MASSGFYTQDGKRRAADAVRAIEAVSGAEIVIAVRPRSSAYWHASLGFGCVLGLATLSALVWLPFDFDFQLWPLEVALVTALGVGMAASLPPLRRLLAPRRHMRGEVRRAARAAMHDLGVTRTRARTGVLVFVSLFEREVEVLLDHGIDTEALGAGFPASLSELAAAVRHGDFDAFLACLRSLAEPLAAAAPRSADDVNELPDEIDTGDEEQSA